MQQQQHVQTHHRDRITQDQSAHGVDETALTGDVACCLADIDTVLAETERDMAVRELRAIESDADASPRDLRAWQARYAHLGLRIVDCCGVPVLVDKDGNPVGIGIPG